MSEIKPAIKTLEGSLSLGAVVTSIGASVYFASIYFHNSSVPMDAIMAKATSAKEIADVYAAIQDGNIKRVGELISAVSPFLMFAYKTLANLVEARTLLKRRGDADNPLFK
jgi:ABC-type Zn uptake system ZnuABC Zn-binding protein ZnuA